MNKTCRIRNVISQIVLFIIWFAVPFNVDAQPTCTALNNPADGAIDISLSSELTWTSVSDADGYRISIGSSSGGVDVLDNFDVGTQIFFVPTVNWFESTTYFVTITPYSGAVTPSAPCQETSFTTQDVLANIAPGGVLENNIFWVKANTGMTIINEKVASWADIAGNNVDAIQIDTTYQPTYNLSDKNYNPGVYFEGLDQHLAFEDLLASGVAKMNLFAVGSNETGGDSWHTMVHGQSNSSWLSGGYGLAASNGSSTSFGFWVNGYSSNFASTPWIDQSTAILEGKYDSQMVEFFLDGQLQGTAPYDGAIGDVGTSYLGGGISTSYNHKGHINEVLIFNSDLSESDRQRINAYLGIKYAITIDRIGAADNYVDSEGNSVFSDNGAYWHDVIGIGRDDLSTLLQKQSHQDNDSTRIYLETLSTTNEANIGSFSLDKQFVMVGHDDGELSEAIGINGEAPGGVNRRLAREWKVTNTGFTEQYSMDFVLKCPIDPSDEFRLLVDSDGDFTDATVFESGNGLNILSSGSTISITGITNAQIPSNSTRYITIGNVGEEPSLVQMVIPYLLAQQLAV